MDSSSWSSKAGSSYWEEEKDISRVYMSIVCNSCLGTLGNEVWLEDSISETNEGV